MSKLSKLALRLFIAGLIATPAIVWAAGSLPLLGVGVPTASSGGSCSQSTAFLARNGDANHSATDTLICGLVTDGVWSGFDAFWIMATDTDPHARLNAIAATFPLIDVGTTPTFTNKLGFTTASGAVLSTQFIPSSSGSQFTAHNGSIGLYAQNNITGGFVDIGAFDGSAATQLGARFNGNTLFDISDGNLYQVASASSVGMWTVSRTAASGAGAISLYHNASSTAVSTGTSVDIAATTVAIYIGCRNGSGTPGFVNTNQYSIAYVGKGFTGAEHLLINNRISTYLAAL